MGWITGAISAVGGALSAVGSALCSGVSALASKIGGSVARVAMGIMGPLGRFPSLEEIEKGLELVVAIVEAIADVFGLTEEEERPEEIGMKAEEAVEKEGIKPENFDSYEEYITYIRQKIEIDKERLENLTKEEKLKYTAVGSAILVKGIEEKEKIDIPGEFLVEIGKQNLDANAAKQYMKTFKEENLLLKDFVSYLAGNLDKKMCGVIGRAIESAIKTLNPELTEREIYDKVTEMKSNSRQ